MRISDWSSDVCSSDLIAFIGLTIPHVARAICGPDHRWLLPWCLVLGPSLLLSADVLGRIVARPGALQVGLVTALLGAPFFIMLVQIGRASCRESECQYV